MISMKRESPGLEERKELYQLKSWFPFRIVYGALSPIGEWRASAVTTMQIPNRLLKAGWKVWILNLHATEASLKEVKDDSN